MPFTYTPGVGGGWVVGTAEPTVPPFGEWTYTIQPVGGWELEDMTQPATFNGGFASIGPQGPAGAAGASATVAIGTTTTGAAGSPATVTNSGTSSAAVFNFTIPQGIQGIQGIKGDTGDSGVVYATSPLAYDALTKTVSIDLSSYATQSWVGSQGYITTSALSGYATESWVGSQGYLTSASLSGYATESWVGSQGYLTSSALSGYATQSWVNSQGFLTSSALTGYATETWVGSQGYITSSALSGYATQSWVTSQGYLTTAPVTSVAGKTGVVTLAVADVSGAAGTALANTFTANQLVNVNTASGVALNVVQNNTATTADAVRITNLGSGNSFVVEDSTNPDSTPFVISAAGDVGIKSNSSGAYALTVGGTIYTTTLITGGSATFSTGLTVTSGPAVLNVTSGANVPLTITNQGTGNSFVVNDQTTPDSTPFVIDASGNVGVKTSAPSTDLEVTGNIKSTTHEITSPPAAGDSSTKVPTTAWVQAEVPAASTSTAGKVQLATDAEAITASNTSKVITAYGSRLTALNIQVRDFTNRIFSYTGSGGGGGLNLNNSRDLFDISAGNSTASGAYVFLSQPIEGIYNATTVSQKLDWSKPFEIRGRLNCGPTPQTSSNAVCRLYIGGGVTATLGDPTFKSIGLKIVGGNPVLLMVHNGTSLSTVSTGFNFIGFTWFDFVLTSDGAGNATLTINGTNTATSANAPSTGTQGTNNCLYVISENIGIITGGNRLYGTGIRGYFST